MKPLKLACKLAGTPKNEPKYKVLVKDREKKDVLCGDPRVSRTLVALMDAHAVIGGAACHWGGAAALSEINSAIHAIMFKDKNGHWADKFNFVNDPGHTENGLYALRANLGFNEMNFETLKGFRSISSKLTGHGESHLNPEGVLLSNGPLGSSFPQAQGLAVADKVLGNNRVTICILSDGASMEGEAKEALAAIPGLSAKGRVNPFVLIVSDNNTKLSGRIDQDAFSMTPTFNSLPNLGWDTQYLKEGHDLQAVYSAIESGIERAKKDPSKPVCIVCKTIKGKGVKSTEEQASGGHGYPLKAYDQKILPFIKEIWGDSPVPQEFSDWAQELNIKPEANINSNVQVISDAKMEKVQSGISRGLIQAAKDGLPVYSVSCDVQGSTGVAGFHKEFPDRFIEVGVAESNMISTAAGLARAGLIPVVDSFSAFGATKGNLPLIMASLSSTPMIAVFSHAGFQDAADGASHQATTYFSAVSSIPDVNVICCAGSDEAQEYIYQAAKRIATEREAGRVGESAIIFIGREDFPAYYKAGATYKWNSAQVLEEGKDVTIVACGPMLIKALLACNDLKEQGIEATVINNPFINSPDIKTIGRAVKKTQGRLITIEDHQIICGMGSQLVHRLNIEGISDLKIRSLGIGGVLGQSAYMADELYQRHGMDEKAIVKAVKNLMK